MAKEVLYTFHQIREQCELGAPQAWRAFLEFYTPLCLKLLEMYLPEGQDPAPLVMGKTIAALAANHCERFRATQRQSEREFLTDIRTLLLETASPEAAATGRVLDLEKLAKLLEGLPLMHQEMLFFKLAGYSDATIERMTRIAPRVAEKAFERLTEGYGAVLQGGKDRCPWPADLLLLLREARATKTDKCPPLHQFLRIQDGQVSWYDKEPVEKHVTACPHCLESWTALREVGYWRRQAPAVAAAQIDQLSLSLPVDSGAGQKKSFLRRLFG